MIKVVTLMTLTEKGQSELPHSKGHFAEIQKIMQNNDGRMLMAYATSGAYDFVAVAEYPTPDAMFGAHVKISELGVVTIQTLEAFDLEVLFANV